ncbi:104R [Iridovirus CN01]|nr:104R [Iridovirus CN01]UPA43490.1 104R [Iridovirus CN01]UPA43686.1 104R [Iridovirus CN01]UPA43848.1 104R [Iridovirus CN01]
MMGLGYFLFHLTNSIIITSMIFGPKSNETATNPDAHMFSQILNSPNEMQNFGFFFIAMFNMIVDVGFIHGILSKITSFIFLFFIVRILDALFVYVYIIVHLAHPIEGEYLKHLLFPCILFIFYSFIVGKTWKIYKFILQEKISELNEFVDGMMDKRVEPEDVYKIELNEGEEPPEYNSLKF